MFHQFLSLGTCEANPELYRAAASGKISARGLLTAHLDRILRANVGLHIDENVAVQEGSVNVI